MTVEEKRVGINRRQRKVRVYFAHPVGIYNTPYEKNCLETIKANLPGCEIVDPNTKESRDAYQERGFTYFRELAASCDEIVVVPFRDGSWGMGVYQEMLLMKETGRAVHKVDGGSFMTLTDEDIEAIDPMGIAQTRAKNKALIEAALAEGEYEFPES